MKPRQKRQPACLGEIRFSRFFRRAESMLISHRLSLKTEELTLRARALKQDHVHYTDLEKKVTATCHSFATTNTFKSQLHYLLSNGYVARIARGVYQITPRGENYLALLAS